MVFVFDLDGTLLNNEEELTIENKRAILEILKSSTIIFASGRMLKSILKFEKENFSREFPTIAYNGGMIYIPGEGVIFEEGIEPTVSVEIIKELRELNVHRQVYVNDELIVEEDNEEVKGYARHSNVDYEVVDDLVDFIENKITTKILAIGDPTVLDQIKDKLSKKFTELSIFKSFPTYLDFVPRSVNKANALRILSKKLRFSMDDVIAFGDNDNDVDIIKEAGLGIAMENGTERVKEVAKIIAPSNNDSGVAKVIFDILNGSINIRAIMESD